MSTELFTYLGSTSESVFGRFLVFCLPIVCPFSHPAQPNAVPCIPANALHPLWLPALSPHAMHRPVLSSPGPMEKTGTGRRAI